MNNSGQKMKLLITVIFANLLLISFTLVECQLCKVLRDIPCNEVETSILPGSLQKGDKGDRGFPGKMGPKGSEGDVGFQGQKGNTGPIANIERFVQEMKTLMQDFNSSFSRQLNEIKTNLSHVIAQLEDHLDCSAYKKNGLLITLKGETFLCSLGWTVFQRRLDGRIADFHRKICEEYANGFGEVDGEFWLGLRKLHQITSRGGCKLRVDLWSWDNETAYAEYSRFSVASEANMFRLDIGGYSGTAGDSIGYSGASQNGMEFTTVDRDNDRHSRNCAGPTHNMGGWWHLSGVAATPNAIYGQSSGTWIAIIWHTWKGKKSLKSTRMKVRCN